MKLLNAARAWWVKDRLLSALLCAALVLHVGVAIATLTLHASGISPLSDPFEYRTIALNVLEHGTFSIAPASDHNPDLVRGPGYPLFLVALYTFDRSNTAVLLIQQLLLVVCGAMCYGLMRRFAVPCGIALVLLCAYLIEPQQWFYSLQTMSEALYSFVLLLAVYVALMRKSFSYVDSLGVGALLGISILIKASGVLLAPLALALIFVRPEPLAAKLRHAAVVFCVMLVVLVPWVMRNYALVGSPTLGSSSAYNVAFSLGAPNPQTYEHPFDELLVDNNGTKQFLNYAYTAKGFPATLALEKEVTQKGIWYLAARQAQCVPRVWFQQSYGMIAGSGLGNFGRIHQAWFDRAGIVVQGIMLLLFAAGSVVLCFDPARRWRYAPLLLMVLVVTAANVCVSYSRMLIPLYPVLAIAAGAALSALASYAHDVRKQWGN